MDALEKGYKDAMIFEDDVCFSEDLTEETVKLCALMYSFAARDFNAKVFYLGHWPFVLIPTRHAHIKRTLSSCTHAYVARKEQLEWLRDHPYDDQKVTKRFPGAGIDWYFSMQPRMYAFYPMIAFQSGSPSSIPKPQIIGRIMDKALSDPKYMKNAETAMNIVTPAVAVILVIACAMALAAVLVKGRKH
jgi:hypothetical protein